MSTVINKETLRVLESKSWPKYNDGNWINEPVLPECEKKYWKIAGEKVVEMTKAEKDVVDADITAQAKTAEKEMIIAVKQQEISRAEAITALKSDGVLDSKGELIGG